MARRLPGRPPASTATQKASFLSAPWHPARDAFETCPLQPWTILAGVPSPICPDPATAEARSPASGSTSGAPCPPALLWDVLDLYDRRWDGRALTAEEFVISANEKTQIPIRSTSHQILPPAPGRSIRVEHEIPSPRSLRLHRGLGRAPGPALRRGRQQNLHRRSRRRFGTGCLAVRHQPQWGDGDLRSRLDSRAGPR